jgi:hypothetical protein
MAVPLGLASALILTEKIAALVVPIWANACPTPAM